MSQIAARLSSFGYTIVVILTSSKRLISDFAQSSGSGCGLHPCPDYPTVQYWLVKVQLSATLLTICEPPPHL